MNFNYASVALFFLVVLLAALLVFPTDFDMVAILKNSMLYDQAQALVLGLGRARPWDARVKFELIDILFLKGDFDEAQGVMDDLARGESRDPAVWRLAVKLAAAREEPLREMAAYERLVALVPADSESLHRLNDLYRWYQAPDSAAVTLRALIRHYPMETHLWIDLAWLYLRVGQGDSAVSLLEERLSQAPDDRESRLLLAETLEVLGRRDEVIALWSAALERRPADREAASRLAPALAAAGRASQAADLYARIVARYPGDTVSRQRLAEIYLADRDSRALGFFSALHRELPRDAGITLGLAASEEMAGRYDEAEVLLRRLHADNPDDPIAARELARVLVAHGRRDREAIAVLTPFVAESGPVDPDMLLLLIECHQRSGERRTAAALLARALAAGASTPDRLAALGDACLALGETIRAADCYRRALEIDPVSFRALKGLGIALQRRAPQEARRALLAALPLDPDDFEVPYWLAELDRGLSSAAARARYDEALRRIERRPDRDLYAETVRARILLRTGRPDEAFGVYRRLLALHPGDLDLRNDLAELLIERGRYDEALALLRR